MLTYHASLCRSFHGDFRVRVYAEAGVEDGIGDLVTELVWVALADRFGREIDVIFVHRTRLLVRRWVALDHCVTDYLRND